MNYMYFEWIKLRSRRWIWLLAALTVIVLPALIKVVTNLSYLDKQVTQGQYMEWAAYGFITYACLYIFLPSWIIILIGVEFGNGHVNLIVFNTSYKFYFYSKLSYCLLISIAFSLLGILTMIIVQLTAPFDVVASWDFYGLFIFQSFFTFFSITLLLMSLTFFVRSTIIAFVLYILFYFIEGMAFMFIKKIYMIELFFLPFHITNILYVKGGERLTANYYNFFSEPDVRALVLPIFLLAILFITYWDFTKRELKPLSD